MKTSAGNNLKMSAELLTVLLVVSVTFVAPQLAWSGNELTSTWDEMKGTFVNSKVIGALAEKALAEQVIVASPVAELDEGNVKAPRKVVHRYVMYPGDYIAGSSVLSDLFPKDYDIFVFIMVGNGEWYMEIEDC